MALRIVCVFSLVNVFFLILTLGNGLVDKDTTQESAEKIGKELEKVMKKVTKFDSMQTKYNKNAFQVKERDGVQMVNDMKKKLEGILQNKIQSILSLADEAESLMKNYTWNKDLVLDQLPEKTFIDSKFLEDTGNISMQEEVSFSNTMKVNLNYSTVHVPTDVYNGSEIIVNSVKYTKDLDKTFVKNRQRDPSLLWQYFGTSTGVYRVYPGYKWKDDNTKDFYDHRRRGWYIQGSSSPKDMVILLDLSGSMVGNKLAISKLSASLLLDTLQENDFVNIVTFNNVSRMLCEEDFSKTSAEAKKEFKRSCSKKLLQATKQNIQYLKDMVHLVKAKESANVSAGFKLALEVLQIASESKNQSGTGCIQTINFFSDGVEQNEYKLSLKELEDGKAKEKQIRVFGYHVGREKRSPFLPIREIACKYRGYFYTIETLSDVRENVTSYLNVLSRPLALQRYHSKTPTWTPLYMDKLGLGLMVTVVAPVYDPNQKDKLLGVVGTDVALPELKSSIPSAKVGVDGYGFSINNNGFIVIHPTLKDDENPPHVSLQDVNVEESRQNLDNLSRSLIDRETGQMSFKMRVLSKDKKRVSGLRSYNFFFTDINGTSFSAAIAMTNRGRKYFDIANTKKFDDKRTFKQVLDLLKPQHDNETVMLSPWDICPGITPAKRASTPLYKPVYADANDMMSNLTDKNEAGKLCNKVELNQLLYGAYTTSDLKWDLEVNDTNGYLSVFVGTNGGLSRVLSPGGDNPISSDVTNEAFYQRASDFNQTGTVVVFTNRKDKGSTSKADSVITASTPIMVQEVLAGVAGMQMKDSTLQEILLNNSEACKKENETYSCYLLDEDGFVVASTSSQSKVEVGKPFAAVHYPAFNQMVSDGLYDVIVYNDSNSKCSQELGGTGSNAMRLLNPLLAVSSYVTWMTQTLFWSLVQFNVFSFFSRKSQVFAADSSTDKNYCTANINYYKATVMNNAYTKNAGCKDDCLGRFFVAPVFRSNLRLVILQTDCGCEAKKKGEWLKKLDVQSTFTPPVAQYRKLPQLKCYAYSEDESKECGSGCSLSPIKLLIIGLTLVYSLLAH